MSLIEHARGFMTRSFANGIAATDARSNEVDVGAERHEFGETETPAVAAVPAEVAELIEEWEAQPQHH